MHEICRQVRALRTVEEKLAYIAAHLKGPMPECLDELLGQVLGCELPEQDVDSDTAWEEGK